MTRLRARFFVTRVFFFFPISIDFLSKMLYNSVESIKGVENGKHQGHS